MGRPNPGNAETAVARVPAVLVRGSTGSWMLRNVLTLEGKSTYHPILVVTSIAPEGVCVAVVVAVQAPDGLVVVQRVGRSNGRTPGNPVLVGVARGLAGEGVEVPVGVAVQAPSRRHVLEGVIVKSEDVGVDG